MNKPTPENFIKLVDSQLEYWQGLREMMLDAIALETENDSLRDSLCNYVQRDREALERCAARPVQEEAQIFVSQRRSSGQQRKIELPPFQQDKFGKFIWDNSRGEFKRSEKS